MKKAVVVWSLTLAQAASAGTVCENSAGLDKALCFGAAGAALLVGGAGYLGEALFSALSPRTSVDLVLPTGERISGKATRKLLADRVLLPGRPLQLRCAVNTPPFAGDYGYASCEVRFPDVAPQASSPDYYAREGRQPSWNIGASSYGQTNPDLLVLSRPLVWRDSIGQ